MAERALADADQADARAARGDERPLLGVPDGREGQHRTWPARSRR